MRVAVRPCFAPGVSGGIEQYVEGLAGALSRLEGSDRFDFVGTPVQGAALARRIEGSAAWVTLPSPSRALASRIAATPLGPPARRVVMWARAGRARYSALGVPSSPPIVEGGGYDVVHFAAQAGERTALPNLYQPWDLQHVHYPEYFRPSDVERRDAIYRPCCRQATYVVVASHFVRDDVVNAYEIDPARGRCRRAGCTTAGSALAGNQARAVRALTPRNVGATRTTSGSSTQSRCCGRAAPR